MKLLDLKVDVLKENNPCTTPYYSVHVIGEGCSREIHWHYGALPIPALTHLYYVCFSSIKYGCTWALPHDSRLIFFCETAALCLVLKSSTSTPHENIASVNSWLHSYRCLIILSRSMYPAQPSTMHTQNARWTPPTNIYNKHIQLLLYV